jgi:hypothetical protein
MKTHTVAIEELGDYQFEHTLCSSHPKCLIVKVWPSQENLFFKVEVSGEVVGRFANLQDALNLYNSI